LSARTVPTRSSARGSRSSPSTDMAVTYIIDARVDEEVDIEPELRKWIVELHQQLERLTHYDLLGIRRSADAKDVKRAYFRLAGLVHPDRFFKKRIGPYKPMIDAIFSRISEAHETLRVAETRAKYDEALDAYLNSDARAASRFAQAPRAPVAPKVAAERQAAMDALKQRFTASMGDAQKHVETAKRAQAIGDLPGAIDAYRKAALASPNDESIRRAIAELEAASNQRLVESHAKKAALEERFGRWAEAAASWQKVVEARPADAEAQARLANALARSGR
jgi:curved DNA-binding protein CbpA